MSFSDPQSVTVGGGAKSFPRLSSATPSRKGVYGTADGVYTLSVAQDTTNARFRREFRLTAKKIAADPVSAVNKELSASCVIVFDEPRYGFTDAELADMYAGLVANLAASSSANRDKLLGGEL